MSKLSLLILFVLSSTLNNCGPSFNYSEEGIASYYSDILHGRVTASGDIYDKDSLTAAHKDLPLGTKVLVTNLQNQKSIWVTINDRGPYIEERIIDLSKRAADSLDMIRPGIAPVKIESYIEDYKLD